MRALARLEARDRAAEAAAHPQPLAILAAVAADLRLFGHLSRETIRKVRAAVPDLADAICPACDDTGHVPGYAGRAEPCHCLHHSAATPPPFRAADEPPGPASAGPGDGGRS